MKLRIRSLETKQTLKVEIPNPCSFQTLREIISQQISHDVQSSPIHLSLNRKDELIFTSPEESIQSAGVTSGDLIYYTLNRNGFSSESPDIPSQTPLLQPKSEPSQKPQTVQPNISEKQDAGIVSEKQEDTGVGENGKPSSPKTEENLELMEIDEDEPDVQAGKSFSVPGFLRKVFTEELGEDSGRDHKLLGIAVHAVLLESGFIGFDPISRTKSNQFHFLANRSFSALFYYTLPDIENCDLGVVKVKFQSLGKFFKVYGSLSDGFGLHSVQLDEEKLVPFLNVVWANCGRVVKTIGVNGVSNILPEKEVFKFWREVKDRFTLPLLIDLCEKVGFQLPPCLMRLPTELKLKILELLPGADIAKVACLCSELRYLASSDDLWKQKYAEQFGNVDGSVGGTTFKDKFAKTWESRKRRKMAHGAYFRPFRNPLFAPRLPRLPGIIGRDYDMFPGMTPFGMLSNRQGQHGGGFRRARDMVPRCNLGGPNI